MRMMKLFQGCFLPRTTPDRPPKTRAEAERGVLRDRWMQYDQLSKEDDTWRQKVMQPLHSRRCIRVAHGSKVFLA